MKIKNNTKKIIILSIVIVFIIGIILMIFFIIENNKNNNSSDLELTKNDFNNNIYFKNEINFQGKVLLAKKNIDFNNYKYISLDIELYGYQENKTNIPFKPAEWKIGKTSIAADKWNWNWKNTDGNNLTDLQKSNKKFPNGFFLAMSSYNSKIYIIGSLNQTSNIKNNLAWFADITTIYTFNIKFYKN